MTSQLDRIEAKLDRLQTALDRAGPLFDTLPDLLATVGNTVDDLAARDGNAHMDERLRRATAVLAKLSDPTLLAAIERMLDQLPPAAEAPREQFGLLGLLGVLREDEVQRSLSFLIHFTRRLGSLLEEHDRK
jgi:uncharacterized protein YjgD (DUF1641 family)